jgi:phage protein D
MILDLLSGGTSAPPGFRRPVFAVAFGGGGGGLGGALGALGGALGGAAAAAAGALAASLGGGGADPWQLNVVALAVTTGLAPAVDAAEIWLAPDPQAPAAALGDAGSVRLGYADGAPELIFTGTVTALRHAVAGPARLIATSGAAALAGLRVNQSYVGRTAGDVVRDLAGRAGIATAAIADGIDLPFYVVDDRRSAWEQVAALARRSGLLAFITPAGELSFTLPPEGGPVQTFTYAEDILALAARTSRPATAAVTASGEGAAGSQGKAAWSWLVKDPSAVQASAGGGDGAPPRLVSDPALRSAAAARTAAAGFAGAAARAAATATLLVPGAPAVTAGSAVAIAGAPRAELNGTFLACGVRHRLDRRQGFTTRIELAKAGGGAGGGGLLGALAGAAAAGLP